MQRQEHKIANNKLIISENCSKEDLIIIQYYWDFQDQSLVNTPKLVKQKFSIDQTDLTSIVRKFSTFSIYLHCIECNSYEKNEAKSQSSLNGILKKQNNSYRNKFNCQLCQERKENELKLVRLKKHKEVLQTLNTAIDSKNWQNLSNYEKEMLGKCLEMNFYQLKVYYGKLLGQTHFIKLIHSLENIANQDLIILERDSWNNYITDYKFLDKLLKHKEEIIQLKEKPLEIIDFDKETDTIKNKLPRPKGTRY